MFIFKRSSNLIFKRKNLLQRAFQNNKLDKKEVEENKEEVIMESTKKRSRKSVELINSENNE